MSLSGSPSRRVSCGFAGIAAPRAMSSLAHRSQSATGVGPLWVLTTIRVVPGRRPQTAHTETPAARGKFWGVSGIGSLA